jgi:hypothetical protein
MTNKEKIKEIREDIKKIDNILYENINTGDTKKIVESLNKNKEDKIRGAIIKLHLEFESLLGILVSMYFREASEEISKNQKFDGLYLDNFLEDLKFHQLVKLARTFNIIEQKDIQKFQILNKLRNQCGHGVDFNHIVMATKITKIIETSTLLYNKKSLMNVKVFEDFWKTYDKLYNKINR